MAFPKSKAIGQRNSQVNTSSLNIFPVRGDTSTATQQTNRSTAVTVDSTVGQITTNATSLGTGAEAKFTVNNKYCTAKSVPVIACASGQTASTSMPVVSAVADGSFEITLTNLSGTTADTGAMVINFILLEGN